MPRLIRPTLPADVELAITYMGGRAQVDILRQLAVLGPSTISQLQEVVQIGRSSLNRHLDGLASAGLVETDPPEGLRHGKDVTYAVRTRRIRDLALAYLEHIEGR